MRFSIRSLLAVMLLSAIAFPVVIGLRQIRREEAMRVQLLNEIEAQRQRLALDDPARMKIKEHQREEFAALHMLRNKAERHFASIQNKYGQIEKRGPDVLSLRTVPQLSLDDHAPPVVFRLQVPTERKVWLKYALVASDRSSQMPEELDQLTEAPKDSGYDHPGPYELELLPGERFLHVQSGPVREDVMPVSIRLDDQTLVDTRFVGNGVPSTGAFHISGRKQIDFIPRRELPWLLNVKIRLEKENQPRENAPFIISLWLSDRSSDFGRFPQEANER